jgi:hypothetical protein
MTWLCYPLGMQDEKFSEAETARRRDALLLRLLKTPPQPRPKRDRKPSRPKRATAKPKKPA